MVHSQNFFCCPGQKKIHIFQAEGKIHTLFQEMAGSSDAPSDLLHTLFPLS
jgi:hypothetical protein